MLTVISPNRAWTTNDFILFTNMNKAQFLAMINNQFTVKGLLGLRRSIQMAMTDYRKIVPANDPRLMRATMMTMKIERIVRAYFMRVQIKMQSRLHPAWTLKQCKIEAKREWEIFIKAHSF